MKFITIISLLFITLAQVSGQVEFDIAFRVGNSLTSSESYSNTFNYTSRVQVDDERYTESEITSIANYKNIYTRRGRMELETSVIFPLARGFHLKTGLGLAYQEISYDNEFIDSEVNILSIDTIFGMINTTVGNPNFKPCEFENSFADIILPEDNSKIWSLIVPLELEYDIIPRLAMRIGGYIETPVKTEHSYHYISSETVQELEDVRICRYAPNKIESTNGSNFSELIYGYSLGAAYRLGNHIGVELLYRHGASGTYISEDSSAFSFGSVDGEFKNRSILIGINYKFGEHAGHEGDEELELH